MKRFILTAILASIIGVGTANAQVHVHGHTRSDGTYVQPHVRTSPNSTRNDNWSTRGNTNPHTGREGTKPRDGESSMRRSGSYNPYRSGY